MPSIADLRLQFWGGPADEWATLNSWVEAGKSANDLQFSTGMQVKIVDTGTIGGNTVEQVVVTWDTPFPDDNYSVSATIQSLGSGLGDAGLLIRRITAKTPESVTIGVQNTDITSQSGALNCIAIDV